MSTNQDRLPWGVMAHDLTQSQRTRLCRWHAEATDQIHVILSTLDAVRDGDHISPDRLTLASACAAELAKSFGSMGFRDRRPVAC